ncbi:hypothetical protein TR51_17395 [Kitasatospora griseola]|uniref:TetR family transcriptional regulator n=1 Tax=Kitasatospora griseola TaxID=2064 RepID=A0A0D0PSU4_KITGR|nr:hypothetical protein [Kitasatospora griseola]KIQ65599.1 hypothetical protein TR51_17395 [Kitasatospora griseola]
MRAPAASAALVADRSEPAPTTPSPPTLVMAVVRGLLFDLTTSGNRDRTDRAPARFCELLRR